MSIVWIFVLEDIDERKNGDGGLYGVSHVLSSTTQLETRHELFVGFSLIFLSISGQRLAISDKSYRGLMFYI